MPAPWCEPEGHVDVMRERWATRLTVRNELAARVQRIIDVEAIVSGAPVSDEDRAHVRAVVSLAVPAIHEMLLEADLVLVPRETWASWHAVRDLDDDDDETWDDD
jgi:hypothetical protein